MRDTSDTDARTAPIDDDRDWKRALAEIYRFLRQDSMGFVGVLILLSIILTAIFAPALATQDPNERAYGNQFAEPSAEHYLGTDDVGRDIFSQIVYGARPALIVGLASAFAVAFIGTNIGLWAGYYGGYVDDILMRLVDFAYGVPFLPFAIVLVALWEASLWTIVAAITLVMWRSTARVIRSHVLGIKEKPYIKSAKSAGASDIRIIYRHIAPNVLPLTFLYGSFAIAWAILAEAGLSFLGFGNPEAVTWGQMLQSALQAQAIYRDAWWWLILPGVAIMLTVFSAFSIGRGYEEALNPELKER